MVTSHRPMAEPTKETNPETTLREIASLMGRPAAESTLGV